MVKNISMKKIFLSLAVFLLLSAHCLAGEWNLSGNLNQGRESFPSVIFNNGNVLVAGGIGSPSAVLSSCEIYEASTGIWSLTDSMTFVRRDFPLVKFRHNGLEKILVAGGTQSIVGEIFDP